MTTQPFYQAPANFGQLFYFRSLADAQAYQAIHGGDVIETTPGRIWRVSLPLL